LRRNLNAPIVHRETTGGKESNRLGIDKALLLEDALLK
jgi:hypothetical protein